MDALMDYRNILQTGLEETREKQEEANEKVARLKEKINEFTQGFEGPGMEALNRLSVGSVKALANKLNIPLDKAVEVKDGFKKDGFRGVVRVFKKNVLPNEKPDISSLSPSEFKQGFTSIKTSLDARAAQLTPEQQTQLVAKARPNLLTKSQEPDDMLRYQNNLHEASKAIDDLEETPQVASKLVSNITKISPEDEFQKALKSTTKVFKTSTEDLKSKVVSSLKKAGEEMGETDEAGGFDPLGDVIGSVVGLGVFLGGILGSRHQKAPPVQQVRSTFQIGA